MNPVITQTRHWIERVVIAHNFCPFAQSAFQQDSIAYHVFTSVDIERNLLSCIEACEHLDMNPAIETSLLIYTKTLQDFDEFLDFAALAEQLIREQQYEGIYQLATFHPDYCFAGNQTMDAANYTNRSPFPMLHLLREQSVSLAADHYADINSIPERNIKTARDLGLEKMQQLRQDCLDKK